MIFTQLKEQLESLRNLLVGLKDEQYSEQIKHLGQSSIGGHTRHILELLECALEGYNRGAVDYLNRTRDVMIEKNRNLALTILTNIQTRFCLPDKTLKLVVENNPAIDGNVVDTTYFREIVYNTEHCIHHLALIKVALVEMELNNVSSDFGMAYSTIKYRSTLTQ